ncbi:hypothetical protein ES703_82886 [subsurface metagenome]
MEVCKLITKFLFSCFVICFFSLPVIAVDYDDFPIDLQQILDERIADLNAEGGNLHCRNGYNE